MFLHHYFVNLLLSQISIDIVLVFIFSIIGKVQNAMFQTDYNALEENYQTQSPLFPLVKTSIE